MGEKRFTKVEHIFEMNDEGVKDNNTKIDYYYALDMIDLLNHLHEENNELKLMLNSCSDQRDEFYRGARQNANRVGKLVKENEQLKQQEKRLYKYFRKCFDNVSEQGFQETWEVVKKYD